MLSEYSGGTDVDCEDGVCWKAGGGQVELDRDRDIGRIGNWCGRARIELMKSEGDKGAIDVWSYGVGIPGLDCLEIRQSC